MVVSCTCRICRSEFRSLIEATVCCKHLKMLRRSSTEESTPDLILNKGVKFKTQQSKLGQFHLHEIAWRNLLLELEEFKKI